jgi:hypothetical protein
MAMSSDQVSLIYNSQPQLISSRLCIVLSRNYN